MKKAAILVLCFAAFLPHVAIGQSTATETGTLIPGHEPATPVQTSGRVERRIEPGLEVRRREEAVQLSRAMMTCAVRRNLTRVQAALRIVPVNEYWRGLEELRPVLERCIRGAQDNDVFTTRLRLGNAYHGLLAEAWILRFGLVNLDIEPVEPSAIADRLISGTDGDTVLTNVAWCLLRTRPGEITAFLTATPETEAERVAFNAFRPFITNCVGTNVTFSVSKQTLRWELASFAYTMQAEAVADQQAGQN